MSQSDTKNSQKLSHSDVMVKYNAMQNVQIFIVHLQMQWKGKPFWLSTVHKQEDTDAIRDSLGHLSSLTGALKIHEIFIGEDLVVKKKMLPSDPFYKAVLIKESRKKSTGTNVLDDDNYDSD